MVNRNFYNGMVECPYCSEQRNTGEPKGTSFKQVIKEEDINTSYEHKGSYTCNDCGNEYFVLFE